MILIFNAGYYSNILGVSWFSVSIEDLAKSAIYGFLCLAALGSLSLIFLFGSAIDKELETQISLSDVKPLRYISIAVMFLALLMIAGVLHSDVLGFAPAKRGTIEELSNRNSQTFFGLLLFDLALLTMYAAKWFLGGSQLKRALVLLWLASSVLPLSYTGGKAAFFADLTIIREVDLSFSNGRQENAFLISERSGTYLLFLSKPCRFSIINKSHLVSTSIFPWEPKGSWDRSPADGIFKRTENPLYRTLDNCFLEYFQGRDFKS